MSVAAVHARIAEIQARIAMPASRGPSAAFGSQLSAAMTDAAGTTTATTATAATAAADPAALLRPAALQPHTHAGKVSPPAELQAYGNGKIPATALAEIGVGEHRMYGPAAEQFKQMSAAAAADGVTIGVTDSYRSYEAQVDLAERKGLYSQGGLAATPGTSNHGWGLSLDLDLDDQAQAWMRTHGKEYGFVEDVPREPWHWTYHGTTA